MKTVQIAGRTVGNNHPVFIVAEIGINHNGDLTIAKRLIDAAHLCVQVGLRVEYVEFTPHLVLICVGKTFRQPAR